MIYQAAQKDMSLTIGVGINLWAESFAASESVPSRGCHNGWPIRLSGAPELIRASLSRSLHPSSPKTMHAQRLESSRPVDHLAERHIVRDHSAAFKSARQVHCTSFLRDLGAVA